MIYPKNYNLLTSLHKRNQKMKMIIDENAISNENAEPMELERSQSLDKIDEEVISFSQKSQKTLKKEVFSDLTEIEKTKVMNTEKIQEAKILIENLKTTSNFLTPENIPKINMLSINQNKNSLHEDSHFYIKESIIRQNSNFLSDNHSLIQEKENFFGNGNGCENPVRNGINRTKNRFSHCNFDSVNKEQLFDLNNFDVTKGNFLVNSQNFEKKKSSPVLEEKKEAINSIEKSFNLITQNKSIVKSAKILNKMKPSIVSVTNNESKISLENEKVPIASARGPHEQRKRKIIPKKINTIRSPKRNTISRKEKSENPANVEKVKEFEKIIKKTKLNQNSQSHMRNNTSSTNEYNSNQNFKKFELNDESNTNILPNPISINKYKFIFSDVDANLNSKNHNYSQGHKHYNSYFKEKEEFKHFNLEKAKEISENQNQNFKNSFIVNKIANFSNILN